MTHHFLLSINTWCLSNQNKNGDAGDQTLCLSHAKRSTI